MLSNPFSFHALGMTSFGIASQLTADGIPSLGHKKKWDAGIVRHMLENEKMIISCRVTNELLLRQVTYH